VTVSHSEPSVRFDYRLLICSDFDRLLESEGKEVSTEALSTLALEHGRVLLQARGGAGKTTMLRAVEAQAKLEGLRVGSLDFLTWASQADERLGELRPEALLESAMPRLSIADLLDGTRTLLLLDGLNEIDASHVPFLLRAVDRLANAYPSLGVIVTDRLHRRAVSTRFWALSTLTPVSEAQVRALVPDLRADDDLGPLRNPYYLQLAVTGGRRSRSVQQREYLTRHGGVREEELVGLAAAAFDQYRKHGDRRIDIEVLRHAVGADLVSRLSAAGTLIIHPSPRLSHHLVHDFLSATHVANHDELWGQQGFDTLTFRATSMDALAMVLEQRPDDADALLRRVYDWNLYGAAYLLAEDRQGDSNVSVELELAMVGMLGERRFDRFVATAEQVSDALRLIESSVAKRVLLAENRRQVLDVIAEQGVRLATDWFRVWLGLFTRPETQPASEHDVEELREVDSLMGWTTSNVLRRSVVSDSLVAAIRALATGTDPAVVRWRAVHTLGSVADEAATASLFTAFDDDSALWVRYGALRSLIEVALRNPVARSFIFASLAARSDRLIAEPQLLRELERALVVDDAPLSWSTDAGVVVERLWADSTTIEAQDRWRHVGAQLRSRDTVNA
jgi:hypothetical protein